ncbi:phospholipase D family protein [Deinococcus sp. YIM 77859]|uniref:phospholipase D family protein n=1 Tax=Deinococcus sp. YIM 77859 TaxID=1540221 RepID=UPI000552202E|nr:phospholipase D family protein [Deinococcus sp. YIM 77859]
MTLFDDTQGTQVVFATFQHAQPFQRDLLRGYRRARVVTYSASLRTVLWLMEEVEELEVIMGEPKVTASLASIAAYQHVTLTELHQEAEAAGKHAELLKRLQNGTVSVLVLKEAVSHAKLYLLDREGSTRVLTGSANLSDRALNDATVPVEGQHEQFTAFDDQERAWAHYEAEYERLRAKTQLLTVPANLKVVTPADLPLLQEARKHPLVIAVPVHITHPARDVRFERLTQEYGPALKEAVTKVKGKFVLESKNLPVVARVLRDRKAQREAEGVLRLDREGNALVSSAGFRVEADPEPAGLRDDAALLTSFFEGYAHFSGDGDTHVLQQDYFAFLAWLYVSPFMSDLLAEGLRRDLSPHKYPLYAVLMGKSSSGKTTATRVFLRSMVGEGAIERPGQDLGKRNLRGLMAESGRLPVYFNDVERNKLTGIASDIKNTAEMHDGENVLAPMVFSLNGNEQGLEDELRKRLFVVQTNHALDPTRLSREERDNLHANATRTQKRIGTALYAAYLARLLPVLDDEERLTPHLSDPVRLSSGVLREVLASAGFTPVWAAEVSVHRDEERVLAQTRATLLGLWNKPRHGWTVRRDRVIIPVRDDLRVGAALARNIPDSLLMSGSTNGQLVVQRDGLERLMGVKLTRPWWQRR